MLVDLLLPDVLTVIMFWLGLGLTGAESARVLRRPRAFGPGAANQLVPVPVTGFGLAVLFGQPPEFAAGTMILALCPSEVMSNVATWMAAGSALLSMSLTAALGLVSILTLPVQAALSVRYFMGAEAPPIAVTALGVTMFLLTAVLIGLGMAVNRLAPTFTAGLAAWTNRITAALFAVLILLALAANGETFLANIGTLGPALLTMTAVLRTAGVLTARRWSRPRRSNDRCDRVRYPKRHVGHRGRPHRRGRRGRIAGADPAHGDLLGHRPGPGCWPSCLA